MPSIDYNLIAFAKLGYTNVSILDNDIPKYDFSNVTADQPITHTWEQFYAVASQEAKWDAIRKQRDELLKETDWAAGTDIPTSITDVMLPYRQSLRSITDDFSSADDVVFPDKPEF